jgi:hypothetical protein
VRSSNCMKLTTWETEVRVYRCYVKVLNTSGHWIGHVCFDCPTLVRNYQSLRASASPHIQASLALFCPWGRGCQYRAQLQASPPPLCGWLCRLTVINTFGHWVGQGLKVFDTFGHWVGHVCFDCPALVRKYQSLRASASPQLQADKNVSNKLGFGKSKHCPSSVRKYRSQLQALPPPFCGWLCGLTVINTFGHWVGQGLKVLNTFGHWIGHVCFDCPTLVRNYQSLRASASPNLQASLALFCPP